MEAELKFNEQDFSKSLAEDMALEIIYGCDRFDKYDIKAICTTNNIALEDMRKLTEETVKKSYPKGAAWSEDFFAKTIRLLV